ncbi:MAG: hypothetical protein N3G20_03765 [Verrucomicrobiae bacterium]|nr:hypothetical protein [Verrucomicrobiae bacterium]
MILLQQKLLELLEYQQAAESAGYRDPLQALIEHGRMVVEDQGVAEFVLVSNSGSTNRQSWRAKLSGPRLR